ncbi:MAG: LacI family DNA-binding transcriptional regulator [Chloroflexota bacterium]
MKRITIDDVAKAAGVSRQTVSRAMNDKNEISPATKARVMETVAQLGYTPNRLAQGMVTRSTRTIGLIIGDITNLFFAEVARGVQDLSQENGYNVVVYEYGR